MNSPHRIEARQNEPQLRSWLLAQKLLYSRVKRLMGLQLTLVVVGIALALFGGLGTWRPDLAQAAATVPLWVGPLFGLAVALLNAFWIPARQQRWRSDAAHVQELFDTELLQMPWPQAGTTTSDDEMCRAQVFDAAQPSRALKDDDPTNWYDPSAVAVALRRKKPESEGWLRPDSGRHTLDDLPLALARLVCQSQNLQWDLRQRDRYGDWLRALFWGLWLLALLPALQQPQGMAHPRAGQAAADRRAVHAQLRGVHLSEGPARAGRPDGVPARAFPAIQPLARAIAPRCGGAELRWRSRQATDPGLRIPNGSNCAFTARIKANVGAAMACGMKSRLSRPMPCSPDNVPPNASVVANSSESTRGACAVRNLR